MTKWQLDFFVKDNGRCPALEFLESQDGQAKAIIQQKFNWLEEYGNSLDPPHVKILKDGLYELRIRVVKRQYRFIYFFINAHIIVVTHGMLKKVSAVPEAEIKKAKEYRSAYLQRMERK